MMKMITALVLAASAFFATPVMAQSGPPADVAIMRVTVGQLESDNSVYITNQSGKSVKVTLSGCEENWKTGEEFLFIRGRTGSFSMIRAIRFFHYYNQSKDWDASIAAVARDKALCSVG